jgi:hypothetical protein
MVDDIASSRQAITATMFAKTKCPAVCDHWFKLPGFMFARTKYPAVCDHWFKLPGFSNGLR